jgi:UDP-3-O-[3-hydroxymyristoyl] glucosamine N-acyltransferase
VTADLGTLGAIAERTGGRVIGDAGVRVGRIAAVDDADATTLTFATDERFLRAALGSRAAAILAAEALVDPAAAYAKPIVAVASPRVALATLLALLETPRPRGPYVDPSAVIDPSATLGRDVYVGPLVAVGPQATIGAETVLAAGVVIGAGARVGAACMLHPRAYVAERCVLGDRVVLQPQAVVGSDGFGWAFLDGTLQKIPQIGIVELGDDVEIGANTCVDRAQTGVTSIGNGTKIENLCQIGHNCRIGQHTAIAAQTGLAGTTTIGDYVQIGGQSGFAGHLTIGSRAKIGAGAEVWGDVDAGATVSGSPARAHRENLRVQASLRRLPKLYERVEALERSRTIALAEGQSGSGERSEHPKHPGEH